MTLKEAYIQGKTVLAKAGNESPAFDAMCLFTACFGLNRQQLAVRGVDAACAGGCEKFFTLAEKRAAGAPLQYLLGEWEFMGLLFYVGEGVLIPREDTEVLVRECAHRLRGVSRPVVLDLCGGSGAVAIGAASLLPQAAVTSLELSPAALAYLQRNITRNHMANVTAVRGDVFCDEEKLRPASLDALVSNPPYIPTGDLSGLQAEVRQEPRMALDGGEDGLRFYRAIARRWLSRLKPGGAIAVEVGIRQAGQVAALFEQSGVREIEIIRDMNGIERVVSGCIKQ